MIHERKDKKYSREAEVAATIREGNFKKYQEARYPTIEGGSSLVFTHEEFTGVDFVWGLENSTTAHSMASEDYTDNLLL